MTFCLGITLKDGIVAIADTRITSGRETTTARKMYVLQKNNNSMFIMTSGLRSLRDKTITYFDEAILECGEDFDKLYKAINVFAKQMRRVAKEDKEALIEGGLQFDIHCIVGGKLENDTTHKLYMLYPEGNWVEILEGSPYQIIGASGYGKPVLDRTLKYTDSIQHALKVSILAFDSTRISTADVDYPIDVAIYSTTTNQIHEFRLKEEDLLEISNWWQDRLRTSVNEIPARKIDEILSQISNHL